MSEKWKERLHRAEWISMASDFSAIRNVRKQWKPRVQNPDTRLPLSHSVIPSFSLIGRWSSHPTLFLRSLPAATSPRAESEPAITEVVPSIELYTVGSLERIMACVKCRVLRVRQLAVGFPLPAVDVQFSLKYFLVGTWYHCPQQCFSIMDTFQNPSPA